MKNGVWLFLFGQKNKMTMPTEPIRILGLINARGQSKGIPRKNIKRLAGKPLIAYSIDAALASRYITDVVVSTDDDEIAEIAISLGADVPFMRPTHLASDEARQIDANLFAIEMLESQGRIYDLVVLLQPTAPLRSTGDIDGAIVLILESNADSVVSFSEVGRFHPYYMYSIEQNSAKPFISLPDYGMQRQQFPDVYIRNGALYIVRTDVLMRTGDIYGSETQAFQMPLERAVNIDTMDDWEYAEFLINRQIKQESQ